jgi:protein SCO1/2
MVSSSQRLPDTASDEPVHAHASDRRRRWLSGAIVVIILLMATVMLWRREPAVEAPFNGGAITPAITLPALELQRADGGRFTTADTRGRLSLFFFGYTSCPDVCPTNMARATQVRRLLGPQADQLDIYLITVDPERDTPAQLVQYVAGFDPAIVGLTGTNDELAQARVPFGAVMHRRETPGSALDHVMDHTASIYLVDQASQLRLAYQPRATPAEMAADVRRLLED